MATDLRTILTALKIITDLERMADHAVDIAKIAIRLKDENYIKPLIDLPRDGPISPSRWSRTPWRPMWTMTRRRPRRSRAGMMWWTGSTARYSGNC